MQIRRLLFICCILLCLCGCSNVVSTTRRGIKGTVTSVYTDENGHYLSTIKYGGKEYSSTESADYMIAKDLVGTDIMVDALLVEMVDKDGNIEYYVTGFKR